MAKRPVYSCDGNIMDSILSRNTIFAVLLIFCRYRAFSSGLPIAKPKVYRSVAFRGKIMIQTAKISTARCIYNDFLLPALIPVQSSFRCKHPISCERWRLSTATWNAPNNEICDEKQVKEISSHRRRRGFIRSDQLRKSMTRSQSINDNEMTPTKMTQYTINDSICPPTEPEVLKSIVQKHIHTLPKYWKSKPVAKHTASAFDESLKFIMSLRGGTNTFHRGKVNVILDSGCGTGKSSFVLGELYPDCLILGIDQSFARLSRNKSYRPARNASLTDSVNTYSNEDDEKFTSAEGNVLLIRAELADFWKCCISSPLWKQHVRIHKHFLLYPNPYPKNARLKNRFYAHPAFPLLMMTIMMDESEGEDKELKGVELVIRSNWEGYLKEFATAVGVWDELGCRYDNWKKLLLSDGARSGVENENLEWHPEEFSLNHPEQSKLAIMGPTRLKQHGEPWTNFEAKYLNCGEPIYEISFSKGA